MNITGPKVIFTIPVLGGIPISETVVNSWIVMAILVIGSMLLTRNLQKVPKGAQVLVEKVVETLYSFVESTMGKDKVFFAPYIGTLFLFSFFSNMLGLFGLRAPTADINTTACWAFIEFMLVQIFSIKRKGVIGRIKGLCDPPIVTPLNLISEFSTPVSMAFRHFGNIAAGLIITTLLYGALTGLTHMVFGANFQIPILAIGLPAVLSVYFDLFTAFMQAFIISMLTMVFTSMAMD
ncbi:F0F1 ATP synthase subunit A [Merdimmobilis hominis]|uniref:ATP synthase subunit a n=1 Tax=uncultured Anaerotruncus sp. TaxID=905011 RepID=A0A6N2R489_9FIRM|nr:FoF1 ATP synthase subunit a [Merdimmobilis hominis]MCD4836746.1 F0F1 ATP synthase subunit A [Merdimmobilis hominis]